MFDALSDRLQDVFRGLRGEARLTEANVESALREIRMALLEADVNFKVVKAFVDRVRDRAMGQDVLRSLTPAQQVVKIVRDEMVALFGDAAGGLQPTSASPRVVLLLGLQGSGKTTTAGKLGTWLARQGRHPMLVSTDVRRPAAIQQLNVLGEKAKLRVFDPPGEMDPVRRAADALKEARNIGFDVVIVDTAGRLHIDDDLMNELQAIKAAVSPSDLIYVADAMTGQDAIKSAGEFNRRVGVTGVMLSKLDGDARGGAALSVRHVTRKPLKFAGVGEKLTGIEEFHPERMASRILGMGDILGLVEEAHRNVDQEKAQDLVKKMKSGKGFDLNDFKEQIGQMRKMGGISSLLDKLPAQFGQLAQQAGGGMDDKIIRRTEGIINSMTPLERSKPELIKATRKRRIAAGAGVQVQEVNRLLNQFEQTQKVMKQFSKGGMAKMMRGMKGMLPGMR